MIPRIAPYLRRSVIAVVAAVLPQLAAAQDLPGVTVWPAAAVDPHEFSGIEITRGGAELWDRGPQL